MPLMTSNLQFKVSKPHNKNRKNFPFQIHNLANTITPPNFINLCLVQTPKLKLALTYPFCYVSWGLSRRSRLLAFKFENSYLLNSMIFILFLGWICAKCLQFNRKTDHDQFINWTNQAKTAVVLVGFGNFTNPKIFKIVIFNMWKKVNEQWTKNL